MTWIILLIILLIGIIIIFFKMPGSKTEKSFRNDINSYTNQFCSKKELITEQDIERLPEPVQTHLRVSGCVGKVRMTQVMAYITSAPLRDANDKPPMMVDYTLCIFADEPIRLAHIQTSMFGIPFEAYDSTQKGVGFMKGVLGKVFTLFNQTGSEMDKAQLLTYLGECFLIPSAILGRYITWEPIDSTHAKAILSYRGIIGSGVFTFDEQGLVQSFQTDQRARIGKDGSVDYPRWSLVYDGFQEKDGMLCPTKLKTIWHGEEDNLVYFDTENINIVYNETRLP